MRNANIQGISTVGFTVRFDDKGVAITPHVQGVDHKSKTELTQDSVFRVASLSKPVFSYLVLKLINEKKLGSRPDGKAFDLNTLLHEIWPDFLKKFTPDKQTQDWAKELTVHNILTHQTGLPGHMVEDVLFSIKFKPGTQFGYSNQGISVLQDFVEHVTRRNLENLTQEYVFDAIPGVENSTFVPPEFSKVGISESERLKQMKGENSLHTSPTEYAHFMAAWMGDPVLREMAFTNPVSMTKDKWAVGQGIPNDDLKQLAWGCGIALQIDDKKDVTRVFHWGDMNEWRAFIGYDLDKKEGMVFAANSSGGFMLLDDAKAIVAPDTDFKTSLKYIFEKLGFTRNYEPEWREKEGVRICKIIARFELNKEELVENGLLSIIDNRRKNTLSIECNPKCAILNIAIYNEFQDFEEKNGMQAVNYASSVIPVKDKDGDITNLEIHIADPKLYNKFIEKLHAEGLLPSDKFNFADKQQKQSTSTMTILMDMSPDKPTTKIKEDATLAKERVKESASASSETLMLEKSTEKNKEAVKVEKKEAQPSPRTPFDSMKTGPKPAGHKD